MPQLQLPIFPSGSKNITEGIAVECRDKQVVYLCGLLPVFQHAEGDLQTFRLITSQLIDMGVVRQVDIVDAFGVPLPTVKRYLKLLRDHGPKVFFREPGRRSASVLTDEARQIVERLIAEGKSVPEVAEASGVKANTLHKAIRAGRLPSAKKSLHPESNTHPYAKRTQRNRQHSRNGVCGHAHRGARSCPPWAYWHRLRSSSVRGKT